MPKVFVVLSTYNGVPYVQPLLESIRRQSYGDWSLLVRDDGSSDETVLWLEEAAAEDSRIRLVEGGDRLGPAGSFGLLTQLAYDQGADCLFYADQDDLWHGDKIERMLSCMRRAEAAKPNSPQLVYSDLTVVNGHLQMVHPSFLRHSRLRHGEGRPLRIVLGRSFVLGCAAAANRELLELALPMPETIASHDWWLALCAAAAGQISFLAESTLLYRRHGGNTSGPAGFWKGLNPFHCDWRRRWRIGLRSFEQSLAQARSLRERLCERQPADAREALALLDRFCAILDQPTSGLGRVMALHRLGVPSLDLPRRILYDVCMLRASRTLRRPTKPQPAVQSRS
ncbi:MAG: glycosyltransferase [Thermoguttaceae bacterium]